MKRHPELDLLRTLAILLMVVYHAAFDLSQFYGFGIDVFTGGWYVLARATATLFLLLSGISAAISYSRMHGKPVREQWRRHVMRFLRIGAVALLVSGATYAANPETFIRFGILHLIAVSALILPLYARMKESAALIGVALLLLGPYVLAMRSETSLLLPLGIRPFGFRTVDYFPLIPWLGVMLIGYGAGYWLYVRRKLAIENVKLKITKDTILNSQFFIHSLSWPGRHALLAYVIHQPLILLILSLVLGLPRL